MINFMHLSNQKILLFNLSKPISVLSSLDHPNIIKIYSRFQIDSSDCILIENCSNGTLQELVLKEPQLQESVLYSYCFQIASAVSYLHSQNMKQLNLNPSHILIDEYNRLKISFGTSKFVGEDLLKVDKELAAYLAPEIWAAQKHVNSFSIDIFALGVTFYFLSEKKVPWTGNTISKIQKKICSGHLHFHSPHDPEFVKLVTGMLHVETLQRFSLSKVFSSPVFASFPQVSTIQAIKTSPSKPPKSARIRCPRTPIKRRNQSLNSSHLIGDLTPQSPITNPSLFPNRRRSSSPNPQRETRRLE